jgi:hypothetical protein
LLVKVDCGHDFFVEGVVACNGFFAEEVVARNGFFAAGVDCGDEFIVVRLDCSRNFFAKGDIGFSVEGNSSALPNSSSRTISR